MKKTIIIVLLLGTFFTYGQNKYKKADHLFDEMHYVEASKLYESAFDKGDNSKELLQRAGDSHYFNRNMYEASIWYDKLFIEYKEDSIDSRYAFRYIHSLKGSQQYDKAKILIGYFSESNILNPIAVDQLAKENQFEIDNILALEPAFKVRKLSINTAFSDFGAMFYGDKIVFSSARDTMDIHTRVYHWNKQSYLNLFTAEKGNEKSQLNNVEIFSEEINTKYHEAGVSFSPDGKTLYFTRNNYLDEKKLKRDSAGVNHLKLYRATLEKRNSKNEVKEYYWTNVTELPFNDENYSVGHPAVSPNGELLYFISDMPGTIGGADIFRVNINENGTYGVPENLGSTINTAGKEMFPFVTNDKIYFSSDGHLGLGSLDIFESNLQGDDFTPPSNLGAPLNSNLDDFGYIVNEETQEGYFSSNRKGGVGDDDIYAFTRNKVKPKVICAQSATGTVVNRLNRKPISNVLVQLFNRENALVEESTTNSNGVFEFAATIDCSEEYSIRSFKKNFGEKNKTITTSTEAGLMLSFEFEMQPDIPLIYDDNGIKKFRIKNLNFDLNKSEIRPDAALELNKIYTVMREYPSIVIKIESHTDSRGSDAYNAKLSDQRAKSTRAYLISKGISAERVESAIGYGESQLLNECSNGVKCLNEKHDVNRRSEFIIIRM